MLVSTMTLQEKRKEIRKDLNQLKQEAINFHPTQERKIKKDRKKIKPTRRKQYCKIICQEFTTRTNNKWHILFLYYYRHHKIIFILKTEDKKPRNSIYLVSNGQEELLQITGHFFSRYYERAQIEKPKGPPIWLPFFKENNDQIFVRKTYKDDILLSAGYFIYKDGVGISDVCTKSGFAEIHTFVDFALLKKEQLKELLQCCLYTIEQVKNSPLESSGDQLVKRQQLQLLHNVLKVLKERFMSYSIDLNDPAVIQLYKNTTEDKLRNLKMVS